MSRNKTQTMKKILDAVGQVLSQSGAKNLGVNAIARRADVDKALIYRYFGSLEELLLAYAKEASLWPDIAELVGESGHISRTSNTKSILNDFLLNQLKEIRRRKVTQEIMRAELFTENALTRSLSDTREKQKSDLLNKLSMTKSGLLDKDIEALLALINAGVSYMVLRSKFSDKHMGIDLHSNFGWKRLEKLASDLVSAYCSMPATSAD
jgi:AcrR family transcriptional regulator